MILHDSIHQDVLLDGLRIFFDLLQQEKNSILTNYVAFTGGTSLLFKYTDFYRFSVDLDFSVNHQSKQYDTQRYAFFDTMKIQLEQYLREESISVFESDNSREIYFMGEKGTRGIKIDRMYDLTLEKELLNIDNMTLPKASDYDIILNKLMRLNETDIQDIEYLWKKNDFSVEMVIDGLQQKGEGVHGNRHYLIHKSQHIRQKNINKLFILSDLLAGI